MGEKGEMAPIGGSHRRTAGGRRGTPGLVTAVAMALALSLISGASRIVAAERVVALTGNHPAANLKNAVAAAPEQALGLELVFALRNQAALDQLAAEQQDARSPRYHQWLTPDEFAARFGPAEADFTAVGEWLKSQKFRVVSADIRNRYIEFSATVSQAERTFGGAIVASEDGRLHANTLDPLIPARFAGVIVRIEGLDNLRAVAPMIRKFPAQISSDLTAPDEAPLASPHDGAALASADSQAVDPEIMLGKQGPFFGPGDLYTFYDETPPVSPGNNGSGYSCIALVEDSNYLDSAVSSFSSEFSLNAASVTRVFADSTDPGITGDEIEALLDIEWAHAVAPGAPIKVYIGNGNSSSANGPIVDAIQKAVSDNACAAISVSFGMCGAPASYYQSVVHPILAQAASQGQSVFVSSGDDGAAGLAFDASTISCVVGASRNVSELSADLNATAVGGTQFTPVYNNSGNDQGSVAEAVWDQSGQGATGGGASAVFTKPSYQSGITPGDGARDVPDVAMISGPPGVLLYVDQGGSPVLQCCYGGTSLAAPIWAAMQALVGGLQGNLNYSFYGSGGPPGVRDVTSGNNSFNGVNGFSAGPGYDQSAGFGTVDIAAYVAGRHLAATPTPSPTVTSTVTPLPSATAAATPSSLPSATQTPVSSAIPTPTPGLWMPTALAPTPTPIQNPPAPTPNPTSVPTATPAPTPVPGGTVSLSAKSLNFRIVGTDTIRTLSFKIRNSGAGRLSGNVDPSALAAPLTMTGGAGPFSLTHNQSTTVVVQVAPTQPGAFSGTIGITSGDPKHALATVSIAGAAAAGKIVVPAAVKFGHVTIGGMATRAIRISNQGPGVLHGTVGAIAAPFNVSTGSFMLSQNQWVLVVLQFAPTSTQPATAMLSISNDDPPNGVVSIPVTGTGK